MRHFRFGNPVLRVLGIVGMTIGGICIAVLMAFLFGWIVMLLWNALMPVIFHLGTINFWQAAGLVILARLLFGGINGGHHGRGGHGKHHGRHHPDWKHFADYMGGDSDVRGGRDSWKHFREFWREEGRQDCKQYYHEKKRECGYGHHDFHSNPWKDYWKDKGKAAFESYLERNGFIDPNEPKEARPL